MGRFNGRVGRATLKKLKQSEILRIVHTVEIYNLILNTDKAFEIEKRGNCFLIEIDDIECISLALCPRGSNFSERIFNENSERLVPGVFI